MKLQSILRGTSALAVAVPVLLTGATMASAQGLPSVEREFANGTVASFYGSINKGFLQYDDGEETENYDVIDNAVYSTRFGFEYARPMNETWNFGSRIEFEYDPYSTDAANILEDVPGGSSARDFSIQNTLRWAEFSFDHDSIGTFSLGQGSMASDGTSEQDLSGMDTITYSGVGDIAGGQIIRQKDGELSNLIIYDGFDNFDGLGRKMRIRYDSRDFSGFGFGASYGQDAVNSKSDDLYDVAVTYDNTFGDTQVVGKAAYAWAGSDTEIFSGSGSVLHDPTGLSLTLAAGSNKDSDKTGTFGFGKIAWNTEFWDVGSTGFAVDYYKGDDLAVSGSDSKSGGISFIQNFDAANLQFWATYREYDYDDKNNDYYKGKAGFAGLFFYW